MYSSVHEIFQEFHTARPSLERSISQLKEELSAFKDGVVLYGAGSSGMALLGALRRAGIEPRCFCDGLEAKWYQTCMGLPIVPPRELIPRYGDQLLVIICINTDGKRYCRSFAEALRQGGHPGVHQRLHDAGCQSIIDYEQLSCYFELFLGDNTGNLPCCPDVLMMLRHQEEIENVYHQLSDPCSKQIYLGIVAHRLLRDKSEIMTLPQSEQYFPSDILTFNSQEHFVDCGAFHASVLEGLMERTGGRFASYYALEPDSINYDYLTKHFPISDPAQLSRCSLNQVAAWDSDGIQSICSLSGPGSFIAEYGEDTVLCKKIDSLLDGNPVTMLKMNIEGSELHALHGAKHSIERFQPKLMIAGYHKTWDLWDIPAFFKHHIDHRPLFLRSYMGHLSFVYYM